MPIYRLKRRRPFWRGRIHRQDDVVAYGAFSMEVGPSIFANSRLFDEVCNNLKQLFANHHGISPIPGVGLPGFIFAEFPLHRIIVFMGHPVAVIKARNIVLPFLEENYGPLVSDEGTSTDTIPPDEVQFLQGIPYPAGLQLHQIPHCTYFINVNGLISR